MKDHREVKRINVLLGGNDQKSIVDMEVAEIKRFEKPTKEDVFRSLRHELEKREPSRDMVVNTEGGRLIALRVSADNLDSEWEQIPPIDGWRQRDRNNGYHYFFVLEPEVGWSKKLQESFVVKGELRDKRTQLGDYIGIYVQVAGNNKFERDPKADERGFLMSRCSFVKESETKTIKSWFEKPGSSMYGNPSRPIETLINDHGKHVSLYFNWPDSTEGQHPYGTEIWDMENRMAMMAIGGDFYPDKIRNRVDIWNNFNEDALKLIALLRDESLFKLQSDELLDIVEKRMSDPEKSGEWMLAGGEFVELWNDPRLTIDIGQTIIDSVLSDYTGMIMDGLRNGGGRYSIDDWKFSVVLAGDEIVADTSEIEGLKITSKLMPEIEVLILNFEPKINPDDRLWINSQVGKIEVDRVIFRKKPRNIFDADQSLDVAL